MDINRNQYFMLGVIVLLVGIQFRMVDKYVLNETCSKYIAEKFGGPKGEAAGAALQITPSTASASLRTIELPIWSGFAMMAVGAVLVLHSLAMKRPG